MKREEWLKLEESKKKPAYSAFTPNEKYDFWMEKFNETILLNWSDSEKKHITKLKKWIEENPQIFDNMSYESNLLNEFERFTYIWMEDGKTNFGWSKEVIRSIVYTGNKVVDINGKVQITIKRNVRFKVGEEADPKKNYCDCTNSSDCTNTLTCVEKNVTCTGRNACGLFGIFKCDGLCQID